MRGGLAHIKQRQRYGAECGAADGADFAVVETDQRQVFADLNTVLITVFDDACRHQIVLGEYRGDAGVNELFAQLITLLALPVAINGEPGVVRNAAGIQSFLITEYAVGGMDTVTLAGDNADTAVPFADQMLSHLICGLLIVIQHRGDVGVRAVAVCVNEGDSSVAADRDDSVAVTADIDDAVHLLGQHGVQERMYEFGAFFGVLRMVPVALVETQIAQYIMVALAFAVSVNAVHDFRRVKNRQVFGNDAYRLALAVL